MMHQDLRHVDVAILYGQGQKSRAQHIARELRPDELGVPSLADSTSTIDIEVESDYTIPPVHHTRPHKGNGSDES